MYRTERADDWWQIFLIELTLQQHKSMFSNKIFAEASLVYQHLIYNWSWHLFCPPLSYSSWKEGTPYRWEKVCAVVVLQTVLSFWPTYRETCTSATTLFVLSVASAWFWYPAWCKQNVFENTLIYFCDLFAHILKPLIFIAVKNDH